ncbi:MAG: hypothetical protein VKP57_07965 [Candidatus Sericytochromatia bacterium]|nr:hypothetical protein [Candidatus Sericytochromatia bacterium]
MKRPAGKPDPGSLPPSDGRIMSYLAYDQLLQMQRVPRAARSTLGLLHLTTRGLGLESRKDNTPFKVNRALQRNLIKHLQLCLALPEATGRGELDV